RVLALLDDGVLLPRAGAPRHRRRGHAEHESMDADLRLLRARGRLRRAARGGADGAGRLPPRAVVRAALAPRDRTRELRALPGPRRDLDRDQAGIARRDPALPVSPPPRSPLVRR